MGLSDNIIGLAVEQVLGFLEGKKTVLVALGGLSFVGVSLLGGDPEKVLAALSGGDYGAALVVTLSLGLLSLRSAIRNHDLYQDSWFSHVMEQLQEMEDGEDFDPDDEGDEIFVETPDNVVRMDEVREAKIARRNAA